MCSFMQPKAAGTCVLSFQTFVVFMLRMAWLARLGGLAYSLLKTFTRELLL